jgi:hypothetical protein
MPYYLAPYVGSGKCPDAFRPFGHEQSGWAAIDLRPDGGATKEGNGLNACLLYLPEHDPSRRLYQIADHADEEMGAGLLHRLRHKLGIDPLAGRLRNFVADVMIDPPRNAWNPLRAARGWYEVYLGGLLLRWPVMAGMTTYTETWTHADTSESAADSVTADLTWTKEFNANWDINVNRARLFGDPDFNRLRAEHDLATADMEVQLTLTQLRNGAAITLCGPYARMSSSTFQTGYSMWAWWNVGAGNHEIHKVVAGSESFMASDTTDPVDGETLKIRCSGTSISGYRNGSLLLGPVTDTGVGDPVIDGTTVGGKRAGVHALAQDAGLTNIIIDDWSSADLAVASKPMFRGS